MICSHYVFFIVLFFIFNTARAQDFFPEQKDYGVRVGSSVEIPGNNLGDYRAAGGANLGFIMYLDKFSVGANLSYREFGPRTPITVQQIDPGHQATTTLSNYSTFLAYLDGVYNKPLTDNITLYGGLNIGMGYTTSSLEYKDDTSDLYLGGACKQFYTAPKIGLTIAFTNEVSADLHAAYNIFMQNGNRTNSPVTGYTGVNGTSYTSLSAALGLIFKF